MNVDQGNAHTTVVDQAAADAVGVAAGAATAARPDNPIPPQASGTGQ
jgi:hypothetical protein